MLKKFQRSDRYDNDRPKTPQLRPRVLTSNESSGIPPNAGEDCGCRKCFPGRPVKETDSFKDTCGCYNPTRRGFHWALVIKKANGDRVSWTASGGVHEYVYSGDGIWKTKTFEGIDCEEEGATPNVYRYVLNAIDKTVTLELVEDNGCPIVTLTFCMVSVCGFKCTCPWTFEVDTFENAEAPEYCRLCITPVPGSRVTNICTTSCRLTPYMQVTIPAFVAGTDGDGNDYVASLPAVEPGAGPGVTYGDWDSENIMPEFITSDLTYRAVENELIRLYLPQCASEQPDPVFYKYHQGDDSTEALFVAGVRVWLECVSIDGVDNVRCTIYVSTPFWRPTAAPLTPLKWLTGQYRTTVPVTEFCTNTHTVPRIGLACTEYPDTPTPLDCDGATLPDSLVIKFVDPPPATTSGHVGTARCGDLDNCLAEECVLEVTEVFGVKKWILSPDSTCTSGCGNFCNPIPTCDETVHPTCGAASDFVVGYKCTSECSTMGTDTSVTVSFSGCECAATTESLCLTEGGSFNAHVTLCGGTFDLYYSYDVGTDTWSLTFNETGGGATAFDTTSDPTGPFDLDLSAFAIAGTCPSLVATVTT